MKKCIRENCENHHSYKIFNECKMHLEESLSQLESEILKDAFTELKGLPRNESFD